MYEIRNNRCISGVDYMNEEDREIYRLLSQAESCERQIDDLVFIAGASDLATYEACIASLEARTDLSDDIEAAIINARTLISRSKRRVFIGGVLLRGAICVVAGFCLSGGMGLGPVGIVLMAVGAFALFSSWVPQFAVNEEILSQGKAVPKIGLFTAMRANVAALFLRRVG